MAGMENLLSRFASQVAGAAGAGAAENSPQGGGKADFLKLATQIIELVKQMIEGLGGKANEAGKTGATAASDQPDEGATKIAGTPNEAATTADEAATTPDAAGGAGDQTTKPAEIDGANTDTAAAGTGTGTANQTDISAMFKSFMETGLKMFEKALAKQG